MKMWCFFFLYKTYTVLHLLCSLKVCLSFNLFYGTLVPCGSLSLSYLSFLQRVILKSNCLIVTKYSRGHVLRHIKQTSLFWCIGKYYYTFDMLYYAIISASLFRLFIKRVFLKHGTLCGIYFVKCHYFKVY